MTTAEIVGAVIASLGGQAIFLAAAGWLVKTVIDTQLAKEMEGFKTNLAVEAHRRTTVFGRLHERRAIVIARVYKLASRAAQAISSMVVPMQQSGDTDSVRLAGVSVKAIEAFRDRFAENRVWFPAATCEKADALLAEMLSIHNYFLIVARGGMHQSAVEDARAWQRSWERVQTELPALRRALEQEFRGILGVEV